MPDSRSSRIWKPWCMLACGLVLSACSSLPGLRPGTEDSQPQSPAPENGPLLLFPGDVIEIQFFYSPELNTVQTIRPDGRISLQLIGEVDARGKSPNRLSQELHQLYSPHFKELSIAVVVKDLTSRTVYIGGNVRAPGRYALEEGLTPLQAVFLAGGSFTLSGIPRLGPVLVMRMEAGKWLRYKVDLSDAVKGILNAPFFLRPNDIVYVP